MFSSGGSNTKPNAVDMGVARIVGRVLLSGSAASTDERGRAAV